MNIQLPRMLELAQNYPAAPPLDFPTLLAGQFRNNDMAQRISPGMRIAIGVGSRGITNLATIVKAAVDILVGMGAKPFVIPAMGSHGGATPEGQTKILAEYGVTADSLEVPIEAGMDVEKIGVTLGGHEVFFSAPALRADGIVVINRVKPHTDFRGTLGSGIQKMLAVGFGKQIGAANVHRAAAHFGHETAIREFAKVILEQAPVICGVALLEDQNHQTAELKVLPPDLIAAEEPALLEKSRSLMPRLPFDEIDLLIVDQIGKEISGTGMDTNIIGRDIAGYSSSLHHSGPLMPHISRILVCGLTPATRGNGIGIGLADFTTARAVNALDLSYMYINATTSLGLQTAKIPIYFPSDREAIQQALATLASPHPERARVVRIANTLRLERMLVSESCSELLQQSPDARITGPAQEMQFDPSGNLLPL